MSWNLVLREGNLSHSTAMYKLVDFSYPFISLGSGLSPDRWARILTA